MLAAEFTEDSPTTAVPREIGDATLLLGDAMQALSSMPEQSFDLAIVDPPYGASTRAAWALPSDHGLEGFGGGWQLASHEWDRLEGSESFRFTLAWLAEMRRLVRPTGSMWLHATYHNAGFINVACQMLGLEIINEVIWFKRNAFPNLSGRRLTASHETLLWVHTGTKRREYLFNYDAVKQASFEGDNLKQAGKQLRTVWDIPSNKSKEERRFGTHPTQKPLRLTNRLITIAGAPGGHVLVPFMGSGSEMVSAIAHEMVPTGIEIESEWFDLACERVGAVTAEPRLPLAV